MANLPKFIACATAVILFLPAGSEGQVGLNVYAGGGTLPVTTDGFADLHLSDWEKYGTGSAEGRVHLPFGDVNVDGRQPTFFLGVEGTEVPALFEIQMTSKVLAQGGWNLAFLPDLDLRTDPKDSDSDEVKLNGDDEALVRPELGSTEQAGVEPKVKSNGYVGMFSVGYRF